MHRCSLCPGKFPIVPPDGPTKCDILFVVESPGKDESKFLKPFVGRTGQEVNQHYLPLAGLRRENVRFVNAICCQPSTPDGKLHADEPAHLDLLSSCASCHLYPEIERLKPRVIITLGSFAAKALDPDVDLELHHGIPRKSIWGSDLVCHYHPTLGMYEPKKMLMIRTDYDILRRWLRGYWTPPVDEFAGFEEYKELTTPDQIHESLENEWEKPLGCDTEITYRRDPYCWSYSTQAGTGFVVRVGNKDLIKAFQQELDRWRGRILFHNWLFDETVVTAAGLRFREKLIVDTMERTYHIGNLPQGLKAIAFRELGMQMEDFEDLVRPHSTPLAIQYFRDAMMEKYERPPEQNLMDYKSGEMKVYRPQGMGTKMKRFLTDYKRNENKDPFEAWREWEKKVPGSQAQVEAVMGPFPGMSIEHAPWERVKFYAARDADTLVRYWPLLERMSRAVRRKNQEKWKD